MAGTRRKRKPITYSCTIETPLGPMTAAAEEEVLTGLWFVGQKFYPEETGDWLQRSDHGVFHWLRPYLRCYFNGKVGDHDFPLAPHGSPLQQEVWYAISAISYGRTAAPAAVIRNFVEMRGGAMISVLDVEEAIERNPISILIPSHRVLARSGKLEDYPGGAERKEFLLRLEGVLAGSTFSIRNLSLRSSDAQYSSLL